MKSLLKHDFYRIIHSKVTLVIAIIALGFPLVICLMYFGLGKIMISMGEEADDMSLLFNARSIIGSVYTISQNVGIVIPIIGIIFIGNDISGGNVRNKVIYGKKRPAIYFSYLISTMVFNVVIITIYFLSMTGFSLLFFKYGIEFDQKEFWNLFFYVISGTFVFIYVGSVTTTLTTLFKSKAPAIILSFVLFIALSLILTVVALIPSDNVKDYLYFVPTHMTTQFAYLKNEIAILFTGEGDNFTVKQFLFSIAGCVVLTSLNTFLGILAFKKKELK